MNYWLYDLILIIRLDKYLFERCISHSRRRGNVAPRQSFPGRKMFIFLCQTMVWRKWITCSACMPGEQRELWDRNGIWRIRWIASKNPRSSWTQAYTSSLWINEGKKLTDFLHSSRLHDKMTGFKDDGRMKTTSNQRINLSAAQCRIYAIYIQPIFSKIHTFILFLSFALMFYLLLMCRPFVFNSQQVHVQLWISFCKF